MVAPKTDVFQHSKVQQNDTSITANDTLKHNRPKEALKTPNLAVYHPLGGARRAVRQEPTEAPFVPIRLPAGRREHVWSSASEIIRPVNN